MSKQELEICLWKELADKGDYLDVNKENSADCYTCNG